MFEETRLLDRAAYGSTFGNSFNTRIIRLRSGQERRNANWSLPLKKYSILFQNLNPEDHILVRNAHYACLGSAIAFRFKDWLDFQAANEFLVVATGAEQTVQLIKTYNFGSQSFERNIYKPVAGTVTLYDNGTPIAQDSSFDIDYTTGLVTFTATLDADITWSGEFDVPVRFSSDELASDPVAKRTGGFILTSDVDIEEVRDL